MTVRPLAARFANETLGAIGKELGLGRLSVDGGAGDRQRRGRGTVSRLLSRALEAVFGAVWLDGGEDSLRCVILGLLQGSVSMS